MSIKNKDLIKLRNALSPKHPAKIADKMGKSVQWINRVLSKAELANKHTDIVSEALDLIKKEKEIITPIAEEINELIQ